MDNEKSKPKEYKKNIKNEINKTIFNMGLGNDMLDRKVYEQLLNESLKDNDNNKTY